MGDSLDAFATATGNQLIQLISIIGSSRSKEVRNQKMPTPISSWPLLEEGHGIVELLPFLEKPRGHTLYCVLHPCSDPGQRDPCHLQ